jgi:hypothetical protein
MQFRHRKSVLSVFSVANCQSRQPSRQLPVRRLATENTESTEKIYHEPHELSRTSAKGAQDIKFALVHDFVFVSVRDQSSNFLEPLRGGSGKS